jgi:hypothetical protein
MPEIGTIFHAFVDQFGENATHQFFDAISAQDTTIAEINPQASLITFSDIKENQEDALKSLFDETLPQRERCAAGLHFATQAIERLKRCENVKEEMTAIISEVV